MQTKLTSMRRLFLKKFGGLSVGLGSILMGVLPELNAQTVPGGGSPMLTPVPLSPTDLNAWYSAALGAPESFALQAKLNEPTRIDPPVSGSTSVYDGAVVTNVRFPIVSYATGLPIAFLVFGTMGATASNAKPIRVLVANTGKLFAASGTNIGEIPWSAPGAKGLFAGFFPKEFLASPAASMQSNQVGASGQPAQPGQRVLETACVAYPDVDGPVPDRQFACIATYKACMDTASSYQDAAAGAEAGAVVCYIVCGATAIVPVIDIFTCGACISIIVTAATMEGIYLHKVQECQDRLSECMGHFCPGTDMQPLPGYPLPPG